MARRGCFGTGKSNPVLVYCIGCDHDLEGHRDGRCTEVVDGYEHRGELVNVYCKCSEAWVEDARSEIAGVA